MATANPARAARVSPATVRLTVGQAVVRFLAHQWSERDNERQRLIPGVLGIFGHGNACGVGFGLAEGEPGLSYIQGKNEQAMVHTAIGFARAKRGLSTLAVTTSIGPGATNLVTGAATATINRIPVLLLPGDVFASRRQGPVLQQLEHPVSFDVSVNDALRPVSRYFDRITRPEQIVESLPQAMKALLAPGAAGAVTLALCQDVQGETYDFPLALFEPRVHTVVRQPPAAESLAAAIRILEAAQRPLVIAGGGVKASEAEGALLRFCDERRIPFSETFAGRGCGGGSSLCVGGLGFIGSSAANLLASKADVIIAVGTRLTDTTTGSHSLFQNPDVQFITLNTQASDGAKLAATAVVADAKLALEALLDERSTVVRTSDRYQHEVGETIREWTSAVAEELSREDVGLTGAQVVAELNALTRAGDRVVLSSSSAIGYCHTFWDADASAACDLEYGFSCMGHELPAALGARLAQPDSGEVFAVLGDGTYLMGNTTELVTAIQEGVRIIVVVLVNNGYQCIRGFQENAMGGEFGTQFRLRSEDGTYTGGVAEVDYTANARSLGCAAFDIHDISELRSAIEAARGESRPTLIAAHVASDVFDVQSGAWWDYGAPNVPGERLDAYRKAAAAQRWYL